MGELIAVLSGKGGTGKTSVCAAVATALALDGKRVLCVDCDVGLRNLDIALGLSDRALMDFSDVMERRCSLLSAIVEHPDIPALYLLTAPMTLLDTDESAFRRMIDDAKDCFDFVIMDSPAGLGDGFQLAMAAADRAIVVSAIDPAALRDAQRAVSELMGQVKDIHLVMNRVQPKLIQKLRTNIDEAMDTAGLPLLGIVPEDKDVMMAAGSGMALILFSHKQASHAYLNIAKRLMGVKVPLMRIR